MSALEAVTNVIVGYIVAVAANQLVLPLFGLAVSMGDSAAIGLAFTLIALIRSFILRRVFEAVRMRRARTTTAGHDGPAAMRGDPDDQVASTIR